MADMLQELGELIDQWRIRANNLCGGGSTIKSRTKAEGYTDCADELQQAIDAMRAKESGNG